jgi:peptidoglycan/xylan/chitin deacetylase (PgdA/CDA1 family)
VVFLTFDACETKTPSYFDKKILDFLIKNKIPATFFISGKFANRNRETLSEISKYNFFSIQNHSYDHNLHMEKMTDADIEMDLNKTSQLIAEITGKKPSLFRFPGGNYDNRSLKLVEDLGYRVVHWSFESGDPDKKMTSDLIFEKVKRNVKRGSIMIFHINGRGWHTSEALPQIINYLNSEGYHLELLENFLKNEKFN